MPSDLHGDHENWPVEWRKRQWWKCACFHFVHGLPRTQHEKRKGGIKAIVQAPTTMKIWRSTALDGKFCVYDDIIEYIRLRNALQPASYRFFLQPNDRADFSSRRSFFPRQHVGKISYINFIKAACLVDTLCGEGVKDYIIKHCTRGTVISSLSRTSLADSSIMIHSGNLTDSTSKKYQNLLDAERRR